MPSSCTPQNALYVENHIYTSQPNLCSKKPLAQTSRQNTTSRGSKSQSPEAETISQTARPDPDKQGKTSGWGRRVGADAEAKPSHDRRTQFWIRPVSRPRGPPAAGAGPSTRYGATTASVVRLRPRGVRVSHARPPAGCRSLVAVFEAACGARGRGRGRR